MLRLPIRRSDRRYRFQSRILSGRPERIGMRTARSRRQNVNSTPTTSIWEASATIRLDAASNVFIVSLQRDPHPIASRRGGTIPKLASKAGQAVRSVAPDRVLFAGDPASHPERCECVTNIISICHNFETRRIECSFCTHGLQDRISRVEAATRRSAGPRILRWKPRSAAGWRRTEGDAGAGPAGSVRRPVRAPPCARAFRRTSAGPPLPGSGRGRRGR